jgi:ariadne-1
LKNAREDAGTSQWIKANTRECPKCHGAIEKGGGCNRMVCRHCNYQFCWLCMKNWDVHGYNDKVCSTWTEPEDTTDMTDAKRNLEKWLFYFDRFNNHELSSKLDQELFERARDRILEVQNNTGMSWIEVGVGLSE